MSSIGEFCRYLTQSVDGLTISYQEPLSKHTSFRIGGPAAAMVFPKSLDQLQAVLQVMRQEEMKPIVLGAGTNVLAPDEGLEAVVICMRGGIMGIHRIGDTQIEAAAGETMTKVASVARDWGLSGLEFAHGIPGTIGGGVYMNAGAYGGELSQVAIQTTVLNLDGEVQVISGSEQEFGYRKSIFSQKPWIIVKTQLDLKEASQAQIAAQMEELAKRRRMSQPLELPSAGSTFKRPAGGYAAALIEQAGLKGFQVGGAQVSTKHSGFVVNVGGATAEDVKSLMKQIQIRVMEKSGIWLEPEVKILSR